MKRDIQDEWKITDIGKPLKIIIIKITLKISIS